LLYVFALSCTFFRYIIQISHFVFFFFYSHASHWDLHSFPTRRSSDLVTSFDELFRERTGARAAWSACLATSFVLLALLYFSRNEDRKSTRLNSSHGSISYAVFCLKKKKKI